MKKGTGRIFNKIQKNSACPLFSLDFSNPRAKILSMKNIFFIIILAFVLAGCSSNPYIPDPARERDQQLNTEYEDDEMSDVEYQQDQEGSPSLEF